MASSNSSPGSSDQRVCPRGGEEASSSPPEASFSDAQPAIKHARGGGNNWVIPQTGSSASFVMNATIKNDAQDFLDKLLADQRAVETAEATSGVLADHHTAGHGVAGDGGGGSGVVSTTASGELEAAAEAAEAMVPRGTDGGWLEAKQSSPQAAVTNREIKAAGGTAGGGHVGDGGGHGENNGKGRGVQNGTTAAAPAQGGSAAQGRGGGGGGGSGRRPGVSGMAAVASPARAHTVNWSGCVGGDSGAMPTAITGELEAATEIAETKVPRGKSGGWRETKESSPQAAASNRSSQIADEPVGGGNVGDGSGRGEDKGEGRSGQNVSKAAAPVQTGAVAQGTERGNGGGGGGGERLTIPMDEAEMGAAASPALVGIVTCSGGVGGSGSGEADSGRSLRSVGVEQSSPTPDGAAPSGIRTMVTRGSKRRNGAQNLKDKRVSKTEVVVEAAATTTQAGAATWSNGADCGGGGGGGGGGGDADRLLRSLGVGNVAPPADAATSAHVGRKAMATRSSKRGRSKAPEKKKKKKAGGALTSAASSPSVNWEFRGGVGMRNPDSIHLAAGKRWAETSSEAERLSVKQIEAHIMSLDTGIHPSKETIKGQGGPILKKLIEFVLKLDQKTRITKEGVAMMRKIQKRLSSNGRSGYHEIHDFAQDVKRVYKYFTDELHKESGDHAVAAKARTDYDKDWDESMKRMREIEDTRADELCNLCHYAARPLEPPTISCDGADCKLAHKKIPPGASFYYLADSEEWHHCTACFGRLKATVDILGQPVRKRDIEKGINEIPSEMFVECSRCKRWMHKTCILYNPYSSGEDSFLPCPRCILHERQRCPDPGPTAERLRAQDLPHGEVSRALEKAVKQHLTEAYQVDADKESTSIDKVPQVAELCVREVSVVDTTHEVIKEIRHYFGAGDVYPSGFPVRQRCLAITQGYDGFDVFLFVMFTYEYGHTCPGPNQRRVLISYLDSVNYVSPKKYRTLIFKEVITAYLANVKERGFHTAHIWSSPPAKGDNYIFNVHPATQRIPGTARLLEWYMSILNASKERGIVERTTNLYDEYWPADEVDRTRDLRILPYLKGDFWIEKAQQLIQELLKPTSPARIAAAASAQVATSSETAAMGGTSATSAHALSVDGPKRKVKGAPGEFQLKKKPKRSREDLWTADDPVMAGLANAIRSIRETFIVAHLRPRSFAVQMKERRTREVSIEKAKVDVQLAIMNKREPNPQCVKLAEENIDPDETKDTKIVRQGTVFDDRESFLRFCNKNLLQFDTLRNAKYASAMLLYFMRHPGHAPGKLSAGK